MKSLFLMTCRLSFLFIFILAISCKKDSYVDEENELVYPVNFTFTNFKSSKNFLKSASLKQNLFASTQIPPNYSEGYIYFWSFNNETLTPDVKYSKSANPSITYNDGKEINYGAGFAFEGYVAGRAANFVGPKEILIKLPVKDVLSISRLGFDMTGSAMGPKDFELHFSFDEGDSYHQLALVNQFGNFSSTGKNSFSYNIDTLDISGEELWLKIIPKAGDRNGEREYSENSGTLRIDNLHLVGIAPTSTSTFSINKLHYFLFRKEKAEQVFMGDLEDLQHLNIQLDLPVGNYDIFFVLNSSNNDLLLPNSVTQSSDLYSSNLFSNSEAEIFGHFGVLEVTGNMTFNIVLQRFYSQIKVEFTDNIDLSIVKKIVIKQEHEPFYYSPFTTSMLNPILDQSSIEIVDDLQANKQIVFNQFMGLLDTLVPVTYTVEVHGDTEILRTFQLSSTLKNNIQLLFRGQLLQETQFSVGFQITKNENWEAENEVSF